MNRPARAAPLRFLAIPLCALALLGSASCAALGLLRSIETPQVSLAGIQPLGMQGLESRVRVDLRVSNPNEFALELDGMRFDLEVNGRAFARGQRSEPVTLARFDDAIVSFEVTTNLLDVLQQLSRLDDGLSYRVIGDLFLTAPSARVLDFQFASER